MENKAKQSIIEEEKENIEISVQFEQKKYPWKITSSQTIGHLKKELIHKIHKLGNKSPDQINLMHKGLFLIDDTSIMQKHSISQGSALFVKVKKQEGCFHRDTVVTLANKK